MEERVNMGKPFLEASEFIGKERLKTNIMIYCGG